MTLKYPRYPLLLYQGVRISYALKKKKSSDLSLTKSIIKTKPTTCFSCTISSKNQTFFSSSFLLEKSNGRCLTVKCYDKIFTIPSFCFYRLSLLIIWLWHRLHYICKIHAQQRISSEKTAKSWLTEHQKREREHFYLFLQFSCCIFSAFIHRKKHQIFLSRTCLQDLHIFKGELYGMSIIVSKKRLNDTRIFLYFSLEEFKHWIYRIIMHCKKRQKILCIFFFFALASDAFLSQGIIINILLYCRGLRRRRT